MLKDERQRAGLSQAKLSKEANIPLCTIEYWERSREHVAKAAAGSLKKIADVLGCRIEDLL